MNLLSEPIRIFSHHPNGGGKIGRYVTIADTVFVGEPSELRHNVECYGNVRIEGESTLSDFSRMTGSSFVANSNLSGLVQMHDQAGALRSEMHGDITISDDGRLNNCNLRTATGQQIRIGRGAILTAVQCSGSLWVSNARVRGCELYSDTRIYSGEWTRPPRVVRSTGQYNLCEGEGDTVTIGCMNKPIAVWRKLSPESWLQIGYTAEELDEIAALIKAW